MVLDLQDKKLFKQKDVRETSGVTSMPTIGDFTDANHAHANATGGGQLNHTSAFSAGAGTNTHAQIDTAVSNSTTHIADSTKHFTEANINHVNIANIGTNSHAQIDTHVASTGNQHGHDTHDHSTAIGTAIITDLNDITSAGADVEDAVTKKHTANADTALGAQSEDLNMNSNKIINVTDPTGNQDAATKAYVNSILGATGIWSCSGSHFHAVNPDTDQCHLSTFGKIVADANGITFHANVNLPNGATVTGVIVYGNISDEGFLMHRDTLASDNTLIMADENIGTEDTTISQATINNALYSYKIKTASLDTTDEVYGAKITYTI